MLNLITEEETGAGIYKIRNKVNDKYYLGSTRNLRKRMREHLSMLRNNKHGNAHLQNAFNKHGEDAFIFEIQLRAVYEEHLVMLEQAYLDTFTPYVRGMGYNISDNAKSYRVFGKDHPGYGKQRSEETKRKISETLTGRTIPESTRLKISETMKNKKRGLLQ